MWHRMKAKKFANEIGSKLKGKWKPKIYRIVPGYGVEFLLKTAKKYSVSIDSLQVNDPKTGKTCLKWRYSVRVFPLSEEVRLISKWRFNSAQAAEKAMMKHTFSISAKLFAIGFHINAALAAARPYLQPIRLQKLLMRDSKYLEDFPASIKQVADDYIADLVKSPMTAIGLTQSDLKNIRHYLFPFIKAQVKLFEQMLSDMRPQQTMRD